MRYQTYTHRDMRRANQAEILRTIYFDGPISRFEVSQHIGISPATVTNIVGDLLSTGILIETGVKQSIGGRPSTIVSANAGFGYFIGIEVGETQIEIQLFDLCFNSKQKAIYPIKSDPVKPDLIINMMISGIEEVVGKSNISLGDVIGIGVGFPGLVDPEKGISMFAPNWGWRDVSIVQVLKQRLSIPVYLDNGAKVQAIAEMLFGAGKGKTNIAVLLMGTGVGSGIIVDGKLFRGTYNNAGEIGHTTINIDGPVCRCGSRGCLEAYIGTNGIIDRHVANSGVAATLQSQEELLEQIVRDALAGDLMSQKTIKETIRYTGCGIANLINAFNPDILLIGGWVGTLLGSSFLPEIIEVVSQFTLPQSFSDLEIKTCQLGLDAVSIGAGALVLEKLLESGGDTAVLTVS